MSKDVNKISDYDLSVLNKNFYEIDKELFLTNKSLEKRLSSGFINFSTIKNEKDYYNKTLRYITRTAYSLFGFISKEKVAHLNFHSKEDNSFCSLFSNHIQIGIKMLNFNDERIPHQLKVDTIISTTFHELYHKRFTISNIKKILNLKEKDDYYKSKLTKPYIEGLLKSELFKTIINILEDKRIEKLGSEEFPGYTFYFEEARKYCFFLHYNTKIIPPYDLYIINFLMLKILMPELLDNFYLTYNQSFELLKEYFNSEKDLTEEQFQEYKVNFDEVKKIFEILNDYIEKNPEKINSKTFEGVIDTATEILNLIPPKNAKVIENQIKSENITGYKTLKECPTTDSFNESTVEVSNSIQQLIDFIVGDEIKKISEEENDSNFSKKSENKIQKEKINSKNAMFGYTEIEIIDPGLNKWDNSMYMKAKEISRNICDKLGFLDSRFTRRIESYEMLEGELDEDELYTIPNTGNKYIFEDVDDIPAYSLDFGILLDESGSMSSKIYEAKLATLSILLGIKDNKHINLFVYGHTANEEDLNDIKLYKYYNTLENIIDFRRLFSAQSRYNNADGFAIDKIAEIMKSSKAKNKILVVVSDGQPSARNYGGIEAINHVSSIVKKIEASGITVIQVCMDYIENSPTMFTNYVPYDKDGVFFENIKKILMTKLNQFINTF